MPLQQCMWACICQKKCMRKKRCACMLQKMMAAQQKKNIVHFAESVKHCSHHGPKLSPSAAEKPKRRRRLPRSLKSTARMIANCDLRHTQDITHEVGRSHLTARRLARRRWKAAYSTWTTQSVLHTKGVIDLRRSSATRAYLRFFSLAARLAMASHDRFAVR